MQLHKNLHYKAISVDHPYFLERGLTQETVATFGLGFCHEGLLANRIIIPIHNERNEQVAWVSCLVGNRNHCPSQYRFSPGFDSSRELFNLNRAIHEPSELPLVLVNGFFSLMKLWQHGVRRIVSTMNVGLSEAQVSLIRQQTYSRSLVVILFNQKRTCRTARSLAAQALCPSVRVRIHEFDEDGTGLDCLTGGEISTLLA